MIMLSLSFLFMAYLPPVPLYLNFFQYSAFYFLYSPPCDNRENYRTYELLTIINSLSNPEDIRIGFVSTVYYALNLELFLEKSLLTFMEANTVLISEYKKSKTLRCTKTDSADCESIARWLMTVEYNPHSKDFFIYAPHIEFHNRQNIMFHLLESNTLKALIFKLETQCYHLPQFFVPTITSAPNMAIFNCLLSKLLTLFIPHRFC